MRRTKIILWSVISALLLALLVTLFLLPGGLGISLPFGNSYLYDASGFSAFEGGELPVGTTRAIEIDWMSGNVVLLPSEGENIRIEETSSSSLEDEKSRMHIKQENGALSIRYAASGRIPSGLSKQLTVHIPTSLAPDSLTIHAVSAELDLSEIRAGAVRLTTISGGIRLSSVQGTSLSLDTTSGKAEISALAVDRLEFKSVSGALSLQGKAGSITADTVSGDVRLSLDSENLAQITVSSTSGDVTLLLPEDTGFSASLDSVSGSFSGNFDARLSGNVYTFGDGSVRISVDTVSGDLRIEKK